MLRNIWTAPSIYIKNVEYIMKNHPTHANRNTQFANVSYLMLKHVLHV